MKCVERVGYQAMPRIFKVKRPGIIPCHFLTQDNHHLHSSRLQSTRKPPILIRSYSSIISNPSYRLSEVVSLSSLHRRSGNAPSLCVYWCLQVPDTEDSSNRTIWCLFFKIFGMNSRCLCWFLLVLCELQLANQFNWPAIFDFIILLCLQHMRWNQFIWSRFCWLLLWFMGHCCCSMRLRCRKV